ncbi:hypothetical protein SAMN04490357_3162 [Streptomyces misionensis]|uniref:DUF3592 domain-containing protein n=2 Tax=Streptomyces TaxID=1883 RepID=A0A1H4W5N8_9ACTN|nr:hypothetical protein SAMN04490357_3162 [Streptomyces misionensis]SFY50418.1 hypothetical protein STEPF1_03670 [Streptomyces sp. F-1]
MPFGCFALLAQSGNFVIYRLMRGLKHHGVEGQAVYAFHEYATGSHRVFFDVCLPEGAPPARFHEHMRELPGPEGTVVPVVYDSRKPRRAKTGVRKDLDFDKERPVVLLVGGTGLVLLGIGALLCLVDAAI